MTNVVLESAHFQIIKPDYYFNTNLILHQQAFLDWLENKLEEDLEFLALFPNGNSLFRKITYD